MIHNEMPVKVDGVLQHAGVVIPSVCHKCGSIWAFNGLYASCIVCGADFYLTRGTGRRIRDTPIDEDDERRGYRRGARVQNDGIPESEALDQ